MPAERRMYTSRRKQASEALRARGLAALLLSPSSDLAYLAGYRVHGSERLTCLVISADGTSTLVVPELESPRAKTAAPDLEQRTWSETEDPHAIVASLVTAKVRSTVFAPACGSSAKECCPFGLRAASLTRIARPRSSFQSLHGSSG